MASINVRSIFMGPLQTWILCQDGFVFLLKLVKDPEWVGSNGASPLCHSKAPSLVPHPADGGATKIEPGNPNASWKSSGLLASYDSCRTQNMEYHPNAIFEASF
jgi:hypothetical protein